MDADKLAKLEKEFGSIKHQGRKIVLAEQADMSNRLMNEYGSDKQFQGSGETYMVEWQADGYDQQTMQPVTVRWHFEVARPDVEAEEGVYSFETLAEDYDWSDVHDVVDRWQ
jgi:hypothetical protein